MKKQMIILAGIVLLFSACSDFLDKQSPTQMSASTFWKSTQDVDRALLGVYSSFRTTRFSTVATIATATNVSPEIECLSDNAMTRSPYTAFVQGGINESTSGLGDFWSDCYNGIAAANYFLDNVERAASLYTQDEMNRLIAQVRFIRAYFYNTLVQVYGNVPVTLHCESVGSGYDLMERTQKAVIVRDVILPDLNFAIQWLPNEKYNGYAVMGSAVMLKLRVLLNNLRYAEAATLAGDYLRGNSPYGACPFSLWSNYGGIFYKEQLNNPEIVFSVMFSGAEDHHTLDQMVGSRMSVYPTTSLRNAYESGDKRRKQTIFELGDRWINNDVSGTFTSVGNRAEGSIPPTGMAFKKYVDTMVYIPVASTPSAQHIIKMRYADLLLMYAEAKVETDGGATADALALQAINSIRTRSGLADLVAPLTRDQVRRERRIELAYEELRYNDLIRWGIAETIIPATPYVLNADGSTKTPRVFDGYVWPVPQTQLDRMQGLWTQNPMGAAASYEYYKSISYLP